MAQIKQDKPVSEQPILGKRSGPSVEEMSEAKKVQKLDEPNISNLLDKNS